MTTTTRNHPASVNKIKTKQNKTNQIKRAREQRGERDCAKYPYVPIQVYSSSHPSPLSPRTPTTRATLRRLRSKTSCRAPRARLHRHHPCSPRTRVDSSRSRSSSPSSPSSQHRDRIHRASIVSTAASRVSDRLTTSDSSASVSVVRTPRFRLGSVGFGSPTRPFVRRPRASAVGHPSSGPVVRPSGRSFVRSFVTPRPRPRRAMTSESFGRSIDRCRCRCRCAHHPPTGVGHETLNPSHYLSTYYRYDRHRYR